MSIAWRRVSIPAPGIGLQRNGEKARSDITWHPAYGKFCKSKAVKLSKIGLCLNPEPRAGQLYVTVRTNPNYNPISNSNNTDLA